MPQFDPTTMAPQIIWLMITFAIFYFFMAKLTLPKIGDVLEERSERVADDLDQAEQLHREGEQVQSDFEGGLAEARAEAQKILNLARAEAQKDLDAKSKELEAKLAKQAEEADKRIQAEKAEAMREIESISTEVAGDIIAKLLGETLEKETVENAVKSQIARRGDV